MVSVIIADTPVDAISSHSTGYLELTGTRLTYPHRVLSFTVHAASDSATQPSAIMRTRPRCQKTRGPVRRDTPPSARHEDQSITARMLAECTSRTFIGASLMPQHKDPAERDSVLRFHFTKKLAERA